MKRFLCIVLSIVLMICMTACGDDESGAKEGKSRDGKKKVTLTPTADVTPTEKPTGEPDTPTPTPTEEPGPEVTATPTPTPVSQGLPVPDVTEGPNWVIGRGDGCDRYTEKYKGEGPAFDSSIDYLYITEYDYKNLAKAVRAQNLDTYRKNDKVRFSAAEMFEELTYEFYEKWYENNTIKVERTDSKVFAYTRTDDTYLGGAHPYEYRTGYSFNSQTGVLLSLWDLISDKEGFANDVVEYFSKVADEEGFWDNWETVAREAIAGETIGWVATDEGLELWFNTGTLAPYATGEVSMEYEIIKYPGRFVASMVGAYGSYIPAPKRTEGFIYEDHWGYSRSERYRYVLTGVVEGLGTMSYEDLAEFLRSQDVEFEGAGDREAEQQESNAYAVFFGFDSTDRYFCYFVPEDKNNYYSTQRLASISITFPGYEFFLIADLDEDGYVQYEIIDCSFDDARDAAVVYDMDDAMNVMIMTMMTYYDDIVSAY